MMLIVPDDTEFMKKNHGTRRRTQRVDMALHRTAACQPRKTSVNTAIVARVRDRPRHSEKRLAVASLTSRLVRFINTLLRAGVRRSARSVSWLVTGSDLSRRTQEVEEPGAISVAVRVSPAELCSSRRSASRPTSATVPLK